jgi:hypothetical protein
LALNIHIEEATEALERVAQDESTGILGFNAGMTLKVWRKQGYLRMYPEGEQGSGDLASRGWRF